VNIALLHPGQMGAAIGAALVEAGKPVHWASAGRTQETQVRASAARLVDDGDVVTLLGHSDLVLSVCPPRAALGVASQVAEAAKDKCDWIYLDANAVALATACRVARVAEDAGARYVDGGTIGPPPVAPGSRDCTSRARVPPKPGRRLARRGWTSV
jgi:3-hydroxyisobutyrate dehydrogenase-like beta-hydroxyacid dehydrogenase